MSESPQSAAGAKRLLPTFRDKNGRSWPKHEKGMQALYLPAEKAFTRRFSSDAHFSAYSVPEQPRRLATAQAIEQLAPRGGIDLAFLVLDCDSSWHAVKAIDWTPEHSAMVATWFAGERVKLAALDAAHPGAFVYKTRAGYRVLFALARPFTLRTPADAKAWRRWYFRTLAYFARRFELVFDATCADWTRLYRLPFVVRDGTAQAPEVLGDPAQLGAFDYQPSEADIEADLATARTLADDPEHDDWTRIVKEFTPKPTPAPKPPRTDPPSQSSGGTAPRSGPRTSRGPLSPEERMRLYIQRAIEISCDELARTGEGMRNHVLNAKALSLGRYVGAGLVGRDEVEQALRAAARAAGMTDEQDGIERTMRSGLDDGMRSPKTPDLRDDEPFRGGAPPKSERPAPDDPDEPSDDDGTADDGDEDDEADDAEPESRTRSSGSGDGGGRPPVANDVDGGDGTDRRPTWFAKGDQVELAHATIAALETAPLTHDEGTFWRYKADGGVWEELDSDAVIITTASFSNARVGSKNAPLRLSNAALQGTQAIARSILNTRTGRARFKDAQNGVAFKNGFVVVKGGNIELRDHAPENLCRFSFPFDYEPDAPRDLLYAFFRTVFAPGPNEEPQEAEYEIGERMNMLQEFIGTCLVGEAPKHQRLLVLFGKGGNGKGETLKLARAVFPPGAVASVAPQRWGERFQIAGLVGKLANFVDEIPEKDIMASPVLKGIVSGDPTEAERKHQQAFPFIPRAGHIFNANQLPGTSDRSPGFFRRFILCPFERNMENAQESQRNIAGSIIEKAHPALVAWAIEGAARRQTQATYTISPKCQRAWVRWRGEADPVRAFLEERLADLRVISDEHDEEIDSATLYLAYRSWAKQFGFGEMNIINFGRSVSQTGLYLKDDTSKRRGWRSRPVHDKAG